MAADRGVTGEMVVMLRDESNDYKINYSLYDIHDIANVENKIPENMIDKENKTLTNDYINYAKPLIMGELQPIYKDGLPVHLIRK